MSSVNNIPLTEEQEEFLKALDEEFKDRYTENDEEFKAVMNEKPSPPPVLNLFSHRNNRYNYNHERGEDRRYHRSYDRHYDRHPQSSHQSNRQHERHRNSSHLYSRP